MGSSNAKAMRKKSNSQPQTLLNSKHNYQLSLSIDQLMLYKDYMNKLAKFNINPKTKIEI